MLPIQIGCGLIQSKKTSIAWKHFCKCKSYHNRSQYLLTHWASTFHFHLRTICHCLLHDYGIMIIFLFFRVFLNWCLNFNKTDIMTMVYFLPYLSNNFINLIHFLSMISANSILYGLAQILYVFSSSFDFSHFMLF